LQVTLYVFDTCWRCHQWIVVDQLKRDTKYLVGGWIFSLWYQFPCLWQLSKKGGQLGSLVLIWFYCFKKLTKLLKLSKLPHFKCMIPCLDQLNVGNIF
jgi:hypothetical protein